MINNRNNRKSNFELLRILSMLLIIGHHLVVHGIIHISETHAYIDWNTGSSTNQMLSELFFPGGGYRLHHFFYDFRIFFISE